MPIISSIGRRSWKVRLLLGSIYALLLLGGVTMVYPFLIMLSGSTKSAVDLKDIDMVPEFLRSDDALYRKHLEGLFNESLDALNSTYDSDFTSFEMTEPPTVMPARLVDEWASFLSSASVADYMYACGYMAANVSRTVPGGAREFKTALMREYGDDIEEVNDLLGTDFVSWNAFYVVPENYLPRVTMPQRTRFAEALNTFKRSRPGGMLYYHSPEGFFKRQYLKSLYSRDIGEYNKLHGTAYRSYNEVHLPRVAPKTGLARQDWELFVRENLNLLWLRADKAALPEYRGFLKAKYGDVAALNRNHGTSYASFDDVPMMEEPPFEGVALSDWSAVVSGWRDPDTGREYRIPTDHLRIHSIEFMFRDWLREKYGDVAALNEAAGVSFSGFDDILPPQQAYHFKAFRAMRRSLRVEFVTRNYRTVLDYILFHGRGIANTAIYCTLAVLFALIVNPLAAYAMSRYRMPSTYKILLFLMLTMAFPPMVTQIPVFLMLRKLQLLNTFAALILPGLANGYAIFLLKGFFDSLPRELYESASIDGASEWTMFWRITMSLSTPILSVVALNAFTAAYSNFMYALLICQDEKMWTMMVWLYQLQERSGQAVMYASLLVAAIPTFVIFVLCQKIIMRGIVVPVEK